MPEDARGDEGHGPQAVEAGAEAIDQFVAVVRDAIVGGSAPALLTFALPPKICVAPRGPTSLVTITTGRAAEIAE